MRVSSIHVIYVPILQQQRVTLGVTKKEIMGAPTISVISVSLSQDHPNALKDTRNQSMKASGILVMSATMLH